MPAAASSRFRRAAGLPARAHASITQAKQEAAIRNGASQYHKASAAAINGRDTECAAFRSVNHDLETCTPGVSRIRAAGRNHALWSLLVKDLALAENQLPEGTKTGLISLGLWAMRYSTLALLQDLSLQPLIDVNQNVLDGLLAQAAIAGAGQHPTAPFSA